MLSILLLLAAAPQAAEAPAQTLRPATVQALIDAGALPPPSEPRGAAQMTVLGDAGPMCRNRPMRANDTDASDGLMWREDGEPVALYRLLERRVDGCPDPIIVNYRVPGSNALGRELGRTPESLPLPRYTPPSVRAD